ncbi:MAG: alpha-N-arabinofuranosidase, partial [Clostridia bacterium]|nr:alpha-N-arabinofuranosidase [Clostridia bacterium]
DEYHWKDGIGPLTSRKKIMNNNWGGVVEDNSFGTHEFLEFCRQVGCEPYVNGNLGSGTVQEMSEWVEYMTFDGVSPMAEWRKKNGREEPWKVKYFAVGNENWGCGGNMRPEFYADQFRRYQTYLRNFGDNRLFKIACGPSGDDYEWTRKVMEIAGRYMNGLSLHYYTVPYGDWQNKGSATEFGEEAYFDTVARALKMEELIRRHTAVMDKYDPEHRVGFLVDEWGAWYDVEPGTNPGFLYQQNTMRDAMVAGETLNIFNNHSDRVVMANIAQMVNVLQAVILTEGKKMLLTPTYHVFDLYKGHQDAVLLETEYETRAIGFGEAGIPDLSVSASRGADGEIRATLVNPDPQNALEIGLKIAGADPENASARGIAGGIADHNTFEEPERVKIRPTAVSREADGVFTVRLPACSVTEVVLS